MCSINLVYIWMRELIPMVQCAIGNGNKPHPLSTDMYIALLLHIAARWCHQLVTTAQSVAELENTQP